MTQRRAIPARSPRLLLGVASAGVLLLGGCAGPAGPASGAGASSGDPVTAVATVLQKGDGPPELCLGGVAESLPPQCGGPQSTGWDWDDVESESVRDTTWGEYAVVGTWDGETFHLTEPATAPDPRAEPPDDPRRDPGDPGEAGPERQAQDLLDEVYEPLGGLAGWTENGYVWITVVYDDGSIQRHADRTYGADRIAVVSALRDAPERR
ncbi:hypothetical protein [Myceligenerans indicum]|uniref:DUF3558 domain-containing protein n=1 Tax=Myceligenerans indicum TaxID=2593663 RepID=A0ABS1LMV8_9MICO|nr:hypothetical protein [Myceligenerans indicum]MBL0887564.1 hypothetical protein [Myceligenerans indicum]